MASQIGTATRNNLIEQVKVLTRTASTDFIAEQFVGSTSGQALPLAPAAVVEGLCLQDINASTTPDYAVAGELMCDGFDKTIDRFLVTVTGTATKAMEQSDFDISAGDAGTIDVSAPGTQFKLERFISPTLCEFSVLLTA